MATITGQRTGGYRVAPDGSRYGTTLQGGADGNGIVYRLTASGEYSILYSFSGGSDGANPWAPLIFAKNGNFYGTTSNGGASGCGTVFEITTTGALTTLYSFSGQDGCTPHAPLVETASGKFIGSAMYGGTNNQGTVFELVIH